MPAGNIADVAVALQTTKGTPSAASQHRFYLSGGGLAPERDHADVEETSGSRLRAEGFIRQARAGGTPQAFVRPDMIGLLLYGAMGAKAVTGAADPFTHTFTLALTQPWLTFWRMLGGLKFERFLDCKLTSLILRSSAGNPVSVEFGVAGLGVFHLTAQETTAAVEKTNTFMHSDGKGQFLFETVPVATIESIVLTINTGVSLQQGDSVTPNDAPEGQLEITIETVQTITDFSTWNRLHYGSATPANAAPLTPVVQELAGSGIDFKWAKRQADGTTLATPERSLQVTATKLQIRSITGLDPNTSGDPLKQTVTYRVYEPAAGSGLTAVLKNSKSTYPAN
jgi:tail tube protein